MDEPALVELPTALVERPALALLSHHLPQLLDHNLWITLFVSSANDLIGEGDLPTGLLAEGQHGPLVDLDQAVPVQQQGVAYAPVETQLQDAG